MKRILNQFSALTLVFILSLGSLYAQMNGSYTINPSGSGGRNYTTFGAAVAALNSSGVNGAVVFDVSANTFNQQVSIGSISGVSSTNTVTFKGAGASSTKLTFAATSSTARHTLTLVNNARFITFRDMTIEGTSTSYAWPVLIMGSTNISDNKFIKCNITAPISTSTVCIPVVMSGSTSSYTSGGTASRILIDSCTITGGYMGIASYGLTGTTTRMQDNVVSNCSIINYYYYGFYYNYQNNFQVINNYLKSTTTTTSTYGMYIINSYGYNNGGSTGYACRINNNTIDATGTYGIYLSSFTGLSTSNNEIINNEILGNFRSTGAQYGIYTSSTSYTKIYHNTSCVNNNTTSTAAAWYNTSGSYLDVRNNNFIGIGTTRPLYINSAPTTSTIDYNNYWLWGGTSGNLIYWAGTNYTNSNYTTVGGANSFNVNQGWTSQTNFAIKDGCINGVNLGITTDSKGNSRNNPPDIGSREATTSTYDVAVTSIVSPVTPASSSNVVKLRVTNNGSASVSNLDASYRVGTSAPNNESFSFSTALASCASDTITFTNPASFSGCEQFAAYSGQINSTNADQNNSNDTLRATIGVGMSGTYTIGGSGANYSSIAAAIADLECGGVSSAVTFLLNAQTFVEQISIGNIAGTSATNTITFKGAGVNSTTIGFSASSNNPSHTVRIADGAKFITFRDMTIAGYSTSYSYTVHIFGTTMSDIRFANCKIFASVSTSSSIIPFVMSNSATSYSTGGTATRVTVDSCTVSGGYFALTSYGLSTNAGTRHQDLTVSNSLITDFYYYGIYLVYNNNFRILGNTIRPSTSATSSSNGIYASTNYADTSGGRAGYSCRVVGNIVENNGTYGIYFSSLTGLSAAYNEVVNNVVKGDFRSTSAQYGLYTSSCSYLNVYHNSFAIKNSTTSTAAAWYNSSGSFLDVKNNNFIGNGASRALYIASAPSSSNIDYNNYYLWGGTTGNLIYWAGANYDQTNYQSVGGSNSYNANQGWPAPNDLTISDGCVNGTHLGVSTDINGVSRSSTPDIGAYEISASSYDASIRSILSPVSPASPTSTVKLLIQNNGSTSITGIDASYQVGSASPVNQSFTLSASLATCASDTLTFTSPASISGCVNFKAYTGAINTSNADQNNNNDTVIAQVGTAFSGVYTVGGSSANYSSINAALNDLRCGGLGGPVTLLLNGQTFTEQVVIGNIPGLSSTNTLTIKGAGTTSTIVNYSSLISGEGHTVRLIDGANNIFFRDMSITSTSSSYAWPVHIMGSSVSDIKFSNCNITAILSSSTNIIPVVMNNSTTSYSTGGTATRIQFDSCNISGGYFAFVAYGGSATNTRHQDLQITNSSISNFYLYGAYLYYHNNLQVINNRFNPSTSYTDNYSIYSYGCYGYNNGGSTGYVCRVNGNTFENNGYQAIYLDTYQGSSTANNECINNVVKGDFRSTYPYPVYLYNTYYLSFYHNTAALGLNHNVDATLYAYSCGNLDLKNNVLITNSTTPALLFESCSNYTIDYNDFWIWDNKSGYLVSFDYVYYDASSYLSVTGANNLNKDMGWKSPTDLIQSDGCTKGTNVGVTTDVRGISRSTPPNLGAYELALFANDIGVRSILSPVAPASTSSVVKLLITNYGSNSVSSLNASYKAGSSSAVSQSFTLSSSISNCQSDTVTFTTNATLAGCMDFSAFTGVINGTASDQNNINDTLMKRVGTPMSGTYTVGGSSADFANLTEAIEGLNCGGINGPVVLKLNAQTFTEQIALKSVMGQSATNTITFQGAGLYATRISFFATVSDKSHTVRLEGDANNYIFRDLSIFGTSSSYAWPVHILGNTVADCKFVNCNILAPSSSSTLVIPVIMNGSTTSYSTTGTASRITFDSCIISGGWSAVVLYGNTASNAVKHQDIAILNSTINSFYQYGIYAYYCVNPQFIGNRITADVSASTTSYGMYLAYNNAFNNGGSTGYVCRINRNTIENNGYYGIYFLSLVGLSTGQNEIYNNVILGDHRYSSGVYGLYMSSCTYTNIYHNSAAVGRSISSTYGALYITSCSYLNIRNNTFIGLGSTPALRIGSTPSSSVIDNNNYFNWDGSSALINNLGTNYNATNFTTVGGANSRNVHQGWPSLLNLGISDGCIRGANLGVMVDVNNVTRDSIPNIGAYEIPTSAYDAGVVSITSPLTPASSGLNTVEVVLKNYGTAAVDSFQVLYQYAGGAIVSELFIASSPLTNCQEDTFTFSTQVSLAGCNNLRAWTGTLDGKSDMNNANDTMSISIGVGMVGTYTVGGSSPDFNTMQDALDALNCRGLNGPVTLSVRPGTYQGQVNFGSIATTSANTLTVMSSTGIPEDVVFTDSTTLTNSRHVVRFMNSKFITLRDVSVINRSKIYGWGVHIFGGSEDIRIANCIISVDSVSSTSSSYIPVVVNGSDNGYTTGGYFKNIVIDSNRIYNGYIGIDMYGTSSPSYPEGLKIRNNLIFGQYFYGIYTASLTDLTIVGNDIFGRLPNSTTSGYGISLSSVVSVSGKPTYRLISNRIYNVGLYGIYLTSSSGNSTDSALIINNMIGGGFRSSTTYGIYGSSSNYIACYNNSVFMKGGTGTTYGLYTTSSSYWSIKNNHFTIDQSATNAGYAMYLATNTGHEIDFNNYFNPNGINLIYRGSAYTNSTYKVSYAGGDNSANYKPLFVGDLDLRVTDACKMPRLGTVLNMVTVDREGNPRSTTATEIGAHEPGGWTNDVAIIQLNNPTIPTLGGVQTVSILVKNFGTTAISSLDASFQWNGGSIVNQTFNFSTPLANCDSAILTFTNSVNINQCGKFAVWTGLINGTGVDQFPSNNLLEYGLGMGLSGSYSVAGVSPDFATLDDALSAIQCAGIAGPTVLNIAPGVYQGQVNIPKFLTSSTNTLTIRSATGNPEDVVFTDSTTVSNNRHIVRLNGAEWIILRDVTIINRSQTLGWGLHIFNQSKNCRIANCIISVDSVYSTSSNYIPVVINGSDVSNTTGGFNQNIVLDSNRINFGYYGISVYGTTSSYSEGIRILNNQVNRPYYMGVYGVTLTDIGISGNIVNNDVRTASGYGIYLSGVSSVNNKPAPFITNNRVMNSGNYGIFLSGCNGVFNIRGLIANNAVGAGFRTTAYGIYLSSSNYWDVWYNTVNVNGGGGLCNGFYGASSTFLNVRNNNFAVTDPNASTSSYALYTNSNSGSLFDFNNYHNPRGTNLIYNVTNYNLANYQNAGAGGANSRHAIPVFEGDVDLRIKDKCFTKGDSISAITTDLFGNSRVSNSPFVGMHELPLFTNDAMASDIIEPVNPVVNSTNYDVKVVVRNVGTGIITTLDVGYELNGSVKKQTVTGLNLNPCDTVHVIFTGSNQASFNIGVNRMRAFTADVNTLADADHSNDTSAIQFFCSNLSGSYTINPVGTGATNFKNFSDVTQALMSCGISGAVTFTVAPGTYNERFELAGIVNGASATNTITIDGVDPSTRILRYDGISPAMNSVVWLSGTKYVTIKNLGIHNFGASHAVGIRMNPIGIQANDSIVISGCDIQLPIQTVGITTQYGLLATAGTSTITAGNNIDNLTFSGNTITGGYYGFASTGDITHRATGINILNNKFNSQYYMGVYTNNYHDTLTIHGNSIDNLGNGINTNGYAIYTYQNNGVKITSNKTCSQNAGIGIYSYYTVGFPGNPSVIANNMLNVGNINLTNTSYGIYNYYSTYTDIAHNSVVINSLSTTGTGLQYYSTGAPTYSQNNIVNNSFVNNGPGYAVYISGNSNTSFQSSINLMDNNNYRSNGSYAYRFISNVFNDLATWQSTSFAGPLFDSSSIMVDPEHLSACNLHTYSFNLNEKGKPIASVTTDIDGETRSSTTPDIGADEFLPPTDNAKVVSIISPVAPANAGLHTVSVVFENKGSDTLTSLNLHYRANSGGVIHSQTWSGSLLTGERDTVHFTGTQSYSLATGVTDTLFAFSDSPNGVIDGYTPDDSTNSRICAAYAGNYALGAGGDFTSFAQAAEALNVCGVSAPVFINVATGTYNEQAELKLIPGANSTNRVTFQSASGMAGDVVVGFAATSNANNYILKLNQADHIRIRKMTFEAKGTSTWGTIIQLSGSGATGSDYNEFEGNIFRGVKTSTTSTQGALVASTSDNHEFNTFTGNSFLYGSLGIYFPGYAINPLYSDGWMIESNMFDSIYYMDMQLNNAEKFKIRNNIIYTNTPYTGHYGIYMSNPANGVEISGNQILFDQAATYPLYMTNHNVNYGTDSAWIFNNFISWNFTSAGNYGFYSQNNRRMQFLHNSIYTSGSSTYGMYYNATASDSADIYNNIFQSRSYAFYVAGTPPTGSDFNNYYTGVSNLVYYLGNRSSLLSLDGAYYNGSDAHSKVINPLFLSASQLRPTNASLINSGTFVGITTDIDGDLRSTTTPSMGAEEIKGNLRIAEVIGLVDTACSRNFETVKVKLKNVSYVTLSNFQLSLKLNSGTPVVENFNGTILSGDSTIYTFQQQVDLSTVGSNTITINGMYPNDEDVSDNIAVKTVVNADNPKPSMVYRDTCFQKPVSMVYTGTLSVGSVTQINWNFNNGNTATGNAVYQAYPGVGPYTVTITATSSAGCVGTANGIARVLSDLNPGSIGSSQVICYNTTPLALSNATNPTGSDGTYTYQWESSADGTNFTDISGATSYAYQPPALTDTIWYRRRVNTALGCGPKTNNTIKITTYEPIAAGSIGADQTICYNTIPSSLTQVTAPSGGDGSFTYRWESSSDNTNWQTVIGASNANYSPGRLTTTTYYRRQDIAGSGCGTKTTNTIKVTVYDELKAGSFVSSYDICPNGDPGTFSQTTAPSGGNGSYTYQWQQSGNGSTWTDISGATNSSYSPGSVASTTYYRRNVISGAGCGTADGAGIIVNVRPLPKAAFSTSFHCFGDKVPLVNSSTPGFGIITNYAWNFEAGANSSLENPSFVYTTDGSKTVKLVVTNSLGCKDSTTRSTFVSRVPQASYVYFYDCATDSLRFKSTTSINCGTILAYNWDFGDGTTSNVENPVKKFAAGTFNVKFKIDFSGGISDSVTQVITVYPKGNLDFDAPEVCYNEVSKFTNTSSNASSYLWDFGDNTTSNATNPDHLYATSGTYTVKLTAISLNGCNLSVSKTHTVKVRPDADIVSNDKCLGDTTFFSNGSLYAHNYDWSFGDGRTSTLKEPTNVYASSGTFMVKLIAINNNGCVDSTTTSVAVHALPVPGFNVTSTCVGNSIQFNNTSTGAVSYAWNFGDGSGSATSNPWYSYATPGKYTVMLTATSGFGCTNSTSQSVDVYPKPSVSFTTSSVCAGTQASFTNTSSISSGTVTYMWYFGDGNTSTSVSPNHTYANAGVYDVKLVATSGFGCTDSVVSQITIHTLATAGFSWNIACLGDYLHKETEFSNYSQNAQTYIWDFGDGSGSTAANPTHEYSAIGVYTVTLTANNSNNCPSTFTRQVIVSVMPNPSFTANTVCLGQQTVLTNTTSYSGGGPLIYTWFIDGTTMTNTTNANYTYTSAGNKDVTLWAQNQYGCLGRYTDHNVTVYSNPIADFTVTNVCAGTAVQFMNQSSAGTYNWNFGNGGSSTTNHPSYTYTVAGTYTVTLTVTNYNNCTSVISKQITVYPTPVADFTTANVCQGTAAVFTNNSTGAVSYNWQFGDGGASLATNPSYIYPVAGTYGVTLQAASSNGCKSSVTKSVTAYINPKASFTTSDVCQGSTSVFTNTSIGSGNTYNWLFGDGGSSTLTNPTRTYANAGVYNVTLTATNSFNCSSVATQTVNVFTLPSAAFTSNDQCLGNNMVFTNQSAGAVLYNWQFGDGSSSPLTHPVKAYGAAGTYNVTLTATNSNKCSHSITKTVNVHPNPVASFTTSVVCQNNAVQLNNTSTIPSGSMTHRWDFGDATTSTITSPQHNYTNKGDYIVTLTSTSAFGCASTVQNVVTVQPLPIAVFTADEVCLGSTTVFNNTSENVSSAAWNFGDGNNSSALSPTHTYATAGSFNVSLTITANNGCMSNTSKAVVVNPNPVSSFTAANACAEELINISNTSTGASNYEWYYGFTGPDKVANPSVKLDVPGNTVIRLIAISAKGCRHESSRTIEVYSRPIADFSVTNTCAGDQTLFVNSSQNAGSYNWQFGDGNNSGVSNPSHQYAAAGNYTVTLTANNARCSDVETLNITVNPKPAAGFTFTTSGKEVSFTSSNKTNVKSYAWTFGDGLFGSEADPKHLYNNAVVQTYNACLNITDNNGCVNESCQIVSINLLGDFELSGNAIRLYPNPNRGNFAVEVPGSGGNAEIVLINLLGVELNAVVNARGDLYEISTDQLPDGAYLVKITLDGHSSLQRIIVAR